MPVLQPNWKIILVLAVAAASTAVFFTLSPPAKAPCKLPKTKKKKKKTEKTTPEKTTPEKTTPDKTTQDSSEPPLSPLEKSDLALAEKVAGNKLFAEKKYAEAYKHYSKAIEISPSSVFYSNRAACSFNLEKFEDCILDCTKSLDFDKTYLKALLRRAQAYAAVGKQSLALYDYTAVCMIEEFKKESSINATDVLLRDMGRKIAEEIMQSRIPAFPSFTFLKAYMDSFRPANMGADLVIALPSVEKADDVLKQAFEYIKTNNLDEAYNNLTRAISMKVSNNFKVYAHNALGTFQFLRGEITNALTTFETSIQIDPKNTNTLIKRASVFMERGEIQTAMSELDRAEKIDPSNPDLFYHRGQIKFLTGELTSAISDYKKSIAIDPNFVYAHIQLAVAYYKNQEVLKSDHIFASAIKTFNVPEVHNYYGEIQMDQGNYEKALQCFEKAISMDKNSPLPYINKAVLYLQWKRDVESGEGFCKTAIEIDPHCDIAYIQLAQLQTHADKLEEALESYDKAISMSRTEAELINIISCKAACEAQLVVKKNYPEVFEKLRRG